MGSGGGAKGGNWQKLLERKFIDYALCGLYSLDEPLCVGSSAAAPLHDVFSSLPNLYRGSEQRVFPRTVA
jgi:hypothetical protein